MGRDKSKDDDLINKDQKHEIDYILSLYHVKDHDEVKKAINSENNQKHKELYDKLEKKGIKQK